MRAALQAGAGPLVGRGKDPEKYTADELRSHLRLNRFILAPSSTAPEQPAMIQPQVSASGKGGKKGQKGPVLTKGGADTKGGKAGKGGPPAARPQARPIGASIGRSRGAQEGDDPDTAGPGAKRFRAEQPFDLSRRGPGEQDGWGAAQAV
mmetsp:Transcript_32205/g.92465  ORF Transcript_32205/g.92465 Transcript_32205/m.92465 type:complete len:150 (+) Transcript_32205:2-451(+)